MKLLIRDKKSTDLLYKNNFPTRFIVNQLPLIYELGKVDIDKYPLILTEGRRLHYVVDNITWCFDVLPTKLNISTDNKGFVTYEEPYTYLKFIKYKKLPLCQNS